MGFNF